VKASRFLTLARPFENARQLEPRLGPILYQLPPQWPINPAARLAGLKTRLHRSSYTRSSYQFGFNNDTGGNALRDAVRLRQKIAGTIARRANARAPRTYTSDR
jgi:uncharacterized protein YecE (DUF72 family)